MKTNRKLDIDRTDKFTTIYFMITNNCNKNCKFCGQMWTKNRESKYMTIEDYKYVILCMDKKDRKNFRRVIITGGESLLHPQFIELINLIRVDFPKAEIGILTNGRLLKTLPQKNLRILPNIKNIVFSISHYPGWNDDVKEIYDNNYKPPYIWERIIRKITKNNKIIDFIDLDYRFPFIKKIRRFLTNPLKRGNVYFKQFIGFRNPYIASELSKGKAKIIRKICLYHIYVYEKKLYNCCAAESYERYYNTSSVSVEFDKNWKRNWFKLPTWKACVHCFLGYERYRIFRIKSRLNNKTSKDIVFETIETRRKLIRIEGHN